MTAKTGHLSQTLAGSRAPDRKRRLTGLREAIEEIETAEAIEAIEEIETAEAIEAIEEIETADAIDTAGPGPADTIDAVRRGHEIASVTTAVSAVTAIDIGIVETAGQRGTTPAREDKGKTLSKSRRAPLRPMSRVWADRPLRSGEP